MPGGRRRRGRGEGKGGPSRHSPAPSTYSSRDGLNVPFVSPVSNANSWQGFARSSFTLSQEARNTELHHSWNSDQRLRHASVAFVSAGVSSAEELTQPIQEKANLQSNAPNQPRPEISKKAHANRTPAEAKMAELSLHDSFHAGGCVSTEALEGKDPPIRMSKPPNPTKSDLKLPVAENVFFEDMNGLQNSVLTGLPLPEVRRSSTPTGSDASEEFIVFAGRKRSEGKKSSKECSSHIEIPGSKPGSKFSTGSSGLQNGILQPHAIVVEDPVGIYQETLLPENSNFAAGMPSDPNGHSMPREGGSTPVESIAQRPRNIKSGKRTRKALDEAAILQDYISNMHDHDGVDGFGENLCQNRPNIGGFDGWDDEEEAADLPQQEDLPFEETEDWDSPHLPDFDELSTSDEAFDTIIRVMSKRIRPSGVQYLVVGKGLTVDDARWLPLGSLNVPGADTRIGNFEGKQAELSDESESSDGSSDVDEQIDSDLQDELDDLADKKDLEDRRKARMTDEKIARLLSKQEELGMGSNDLFLFDGNELEEDVGGVKGNFLSLAGARRNLPASKKTRLRNSFPSENTSADVLDQDPYNGFDVMDRERPSVCKKPKGRRGKLTWEHSDSEMEQSLQMAWDNDRTKKKARKQEREELRAQGLLGKKNKANFNAKYAEGMSMNQIKVEIRDFLVSSIESRPLPPMAQRERKIVHEIANALQLKSKSIGAGKKRFPVLYKSSRTPQYSENTSHSIDALLNQKRFLPRLDKAKKRGLPASRVRGGGFAGAGVSYRDGETVGATAPEIGQDNKGRAMLEKLGWTTGTALGALNNKGITQPVAQIVKTTKAGLG